MGAGIAGAGATPACRFASRTRPEPSGSGLAYVRGLLDERRKRGASPGSRYEKRIDQLSPSLDYIRPGARRAS
jgi:hypothetical protein